MIIDSNELNQILQEARLSSLQNRYAGGFELMLSQSKHTINIVNQVATTTLEEQFSELCPRITMLGFGSLSRLEMVSNSDLDLHIIDSIDTALSKKYIQSVKEQLLHIRFGKQDIPSWRTTDQMRVYAEKSITEGNQVFDSCYIWGFHPNFDVVREIKEEYDTLDRKIKNFVFQYYYLEHYYKQKTFQDVVNVKYSSGGTRDFLFFNWFNNFFYEKQKNNEEPWIQQSIRNLKKNNFLTEEEHTVLFRSISDISLIRNEILEINSGTDFHGLTLIDPRTTSALLKKSSLLKYLKINSVGQTINYVNQLRANISTIKHKLFNTLHSLEKEKAQPWTIRKDTLDKGSVPSPHLESSDLEHIIHIWNTKKLESDYLSDLIKNTQDWTILASLACQNIEKKYLESIMHRTLNIPGLGYIMRIIGRNTNTTDDLLRKITENQNLFLRYRNVAKVRLESNIKNAINKA